MTDASSDGRKAGWRSRFKGLSYRIYVAFLLAAGIPTSIAGVVGIFYSLNTLKQETLLHLEQETAGRADALTRFFDQLSSELRTLATSSALQEMAAEDVFSPRTRLQRDFAAFAQAYPYIYQIRYLDGSGREIVRVDRREQGVVIVSDDQLQNKSDRYYVQETMTLSPGEIYVSPLDLNVERGEPEFPQRPVIRFGTPVVRENGGFQGMLIINLHADVVLDQVRRMAKAREGNVYLFSRSGFYLSRSVDPDAPPDFAMHSLEELTPMFSRAFLARVLEGQRGADDQGEWIVAFAPVKKSLLENERDAPMEWSVVLAFPRRQLYAAIFSLYMLYGVLAGSLGVTAMAGFLLSRRLLRPLTLLSEEAGKIAQGHFSSRVEIAGEDEIAQLGTRFNQMAGELERSYAALRQQRDSLETEVQARTAALDRERRHLATIIQNTGDGILAVARDGIIELANVAAERLLGVGAGALADRSIRSFWPEWAADAVVQEGTGSQVVELQVHDRLLAVGSAPIPGNGGEEHGFILVLRDVSEERRLQDERRELDRQIFQTEKMTAMGELAMGLAHEIGNPLAGMKTVVQSLLEEDQNDHTRLNLKRMENEIDRLTGFLRTFHGFAAPQAMHPVSCRLEEVLQDVLLWTRKEAKSKGIIIRYRHCAEGVSPLWADPNRLKQVLLNLVLNAIHATGKEGRITVSMCGPFPGEARPGSVPRVRFCIEDTGPGIPEKLVPRIFAPFFTTRANGTGLGLAVVKKIALQHGADITVGRGDRGGALFEFDWPIAVDGTSPPRLQEDPPCGRRANHG
ncbi:MAG: HAMP domain-containing protein [Magnetococcales bacterium]|nr:HAMP domain-containing protein [Magnetococcales bacterium]